MRDQVTKHSGARKSKSGGNQDVHPMCNRYSTAKASIVHHQEGSLKALKKGDKGSDSTKIEHYEPHK